MSEMLSPPKGDNRQRRNSASGASSQLRRFLLVVALWLSSALLAGGWTLYDLQGGWLHIEWQRISVLFFLFLLLPLLYATTWGQRRRDARLKVGRIQALAGGPRGLRAYLNDLPAVLRNVGLAFCILALARPVNITQPAQVEEEGIDLIVALDLSGSMAAIMENLPKDLRQFTPEANERQIPPTRLEAAQAVLRDFIRRRSTDRIGVVVFAEKAFVLAPPTLDYQLLDTLIAEMELGVVSPNGTAIGDALGVAVARLRRSEAASKAIILLTDGADQGSQISPEYSAKLAQEQQIMVYPIQIGQGDIAKVLTGYFLGQPRFAQQSFPTNPELLKKLAEITGGTMQIAVDAEALQTSLHDALNQLEKTSFESAQSSYQELFRLFLIPGVCLIFAEILLKAFWLRRFS